MIPHINLWRPKLYDAYNSLEADYDFEDFDENTFIRSLKTMTEAEMDSLEEEYFRIYNSHSDLWEKVYDAEKTFPEDYGF